ncbi:Protein of unknown function [Leuconostoc citreum LBAE E16]|nr:Protein of unknown function [Leuconostoc citreum LBAE C11]CCF29425.1 Protein of unknown function [Leuconostoc citreum LBAE E16]
MEINLSSKKG